MQMEHSTVGAQVPLYLGIADMCLFRTADVDEWDLIEY